MVVPIPNVYKVLALVIGCDFVS